jgi:hypothetical protein
MKPPCLPAVTVRDRELLDRLSQHEPLSTSELHLLFFLVFILVVNGSSSSKRKTS